MIDYDYASPVFDRLDPYVALQRYNAVSSITIFTNIKGNILSFAIARHYDCVIKSTYSPQ